MTSGVVEVEDLVIDPVVVIVPVPVPVIVPEPVVAVVEFP